MNNKVFNKEKDVNVFSTSYINDKLTASDKSTFMAAAGDYSCLSTAYDSCRLAASGELSVLEASGDFCYLAASGFNSQLSASGKHSNLAASNDSCVLKASGDYSKLATAGDRSKSEASGRFSKLTSSGDCSNLQVSGEHSIVVGIGKENVAKAKKGCWITLAEWKWLFKEQDYVPVCVKTEFVDGERIKEDTYYKLVDGVFTEVPS